MYVHGLVVSYGVVASTAIFCITFGPTYVVLYCCILGELVTIVIVICTVRTGCTLVLSGL